MKELKINTDFIKTAEVLVDAELGRLFRGMLHYASSGTELTFSGNERIVWPAVKVDIDRQEGQYQNKVNGAAKARALKFLDIKPNQVDIKGNQVDIKSNQTDIRKEEGEKEAAPPKDAPREKVSPRTPFLKENPPENPPPEESGEEEKTQSVRVRSAVEDAFDEFWKAYPKKVGKKDAFRAFQKVPAAERPLLVPAVEMQKQSRQWQAEGGRFIPNPSTWINQGRWLDEPQKEEPERKPAADQKPVKPNQVVASMKYNWNDMDDLLAGLDNI